MHGTFTELEIRASVAFAAGDLSDLLHNLEKHDKRACRATLTQAVAKLQDIRYRLEALETYLRDALALSGSDAAAAVEALVKSTDEFVGSAARQLRWVLGTIEDLAPTPEVKRDAAGRVDEAIYQHIGAVQTALLDRFFPEPAPPRIPRTPIHAPDE